MKQYLNVCTIGDRVLVRGIDEDGNRYAEEVQYKPYAFLESPTKTEYKSIDGRYLKKVQSDSLFDYYQFKKRCKDQRISVYGMDNIIPQYMTDNFTVDYDFSNTRIFVVDIENKMVDDNGKRFGIDPEGAYGEITAITIYNSSDQSYQVYGTGVWKNNDYQQLNVIYHHCEDEFELLSMFVKYWTNNYPDIVTGWNSNGYDIPYLVNRITKVISESVAKKLSPWNKISKRDRYDDKGRHYIEYTLYGISCIDYIQIYKKNTLHGQESYALDFISEVELGEGKLDYKQLGYTDLDDLLERNYQLYVDYNIKDVVNVVNIDKKNKFMSIVIGVAHYAIVNYDEVYSPIKCWDSIRHRYMREFGMVTSSKSNKKKDDKFTGAYVKHPRPGKYKWIVTFDLSSLYPSIIMTANIGDEMMISEDEIPEELKSLYDRNIVNDILNYEISEEQHKALIDNHLTMTGNGMFYRNIEKCINTNLYDVVLGERRIAKNKMLQYKDDLERAKERGKDTKELEYKVTEYNNLQETRKVLANSLYGILGAPYYRYFDLRLAESVTLTGQTIIKWSEKKINEYLNKVLNTDVDYVIAMDTDSIMVNFEPLVNKMNMGDDIEKTTEFLDKVGDQINVKLAEFYDELGTIMNSTNNKMSMKREIISDTAIFKAKKMYAMSVKNNEGVKYTEPEYKIMGLEIVRSTTPKYIREKLKKALTMMLSDCTQTELLEYSDKVKEEYFKQKDVVDIAFPSGCNNIKKYTNQRTIYSSGTPNHVRGAILFNKYYADDYNRILDGDKVRYIYLNVPNPINENIISVKDDHVPDELWKYIDWETNFEKVYLKPVEGLAKTLGWTMSNTLSLADLL